MPKINISQYRLGHIIEIQVDVPENIYQMAQNQIIECETLSNGFLVIYSRKKDWSEDIQLSELMKIDSIDSRSHLNTLMKLEKLIEKVHNTNLIKEE